MIRNVQIEDAQELLDIYNYYVVNTVITFDLEALSLDAFKEKITTVSDDYPFIVGKKIVNQTVYDELSLNHQSDNNDSGFFPSYRKK